MARDWNWTRGRGSPVPQPAASRNLSGSPTLPPLPALFQGGVCGVETRTRQEEELYNREKRRRTSGDRDRQPERSRGRLGIRLTTRETVQTDRDVGVPRAEERSLRRLYTDSTLGRGRPARRAGARGCSGACGPGLGGGRERVGVHVQVPGSCRLPAAAAAPPLSLSRRYHDPSPLAVRALTSGTTAGADWVDGRVWESGSQVSPSSYSGNWASHPGETRGAEVSAAPQVPPPSEQPPNPLRSRRSSLPPRLPPRALPVSGTRRPALDLAHSLQAHRSLQPPPSVTAISCSKREANLRRLATIPRVLPAIYPGPEKWRRESPESPLYLLPCHLRPTISCEGAQRTGSEMGPSAYFSLGPGPGASAVFAVASRTCTPRRSGCASRPRHLVAALGRLRTEKPCGAREGSGTAEWGQDQG
ncbi:uncharacterized protein LOC141581931 [Saimiri boliviensis]|uniref:uncharacterized protein LOC141581931 n=1 Tax=Saimiri boliviensis TaxID=27679 RepID=UPI003D77B4D3